MYLLGHTILHLRWVIGIVNPSSWYPMMAMADTQISQLLLLNLDISRSYITRWRAQYSSYNDITPVRLCTHGWHRPNMRAMGCLSRVLQRKNDRAISRAYCIMVQQQLEQLDSLWDCLRARYFHSRASYGESCEFFKEKWPRYIERSLPR